MVRWNPARRPSFARRTFCCAVLLLLTTLAWPSPVQAHPADTAAMQRRIQRLEATVRRLREKIERLRRAQPPERPRADTAVEKPDTPPARRVHDTPPRPTRARFARVQTNMTPHEVRDLLGPPDRIREGDYPSLLAALRGRGKRIRWSWQVTRTEESNARAIVIFRGGRVLDRGWRSAPDAD